MCSARSLGSAKQFLGQRPVLVLGLAAPARAGDGPEIDPVSFEADHDLRRSADHGGAAAAQEVHVGRGIDQAQGPVDLVGLDTDLGLEPLGRHDLEDVACLDVLLGLEHGLFVPGLGEI